MAGEREKPDHIQPDDPPGYQICGTGESVVGSQDHAQDRARITDAMLRCLGGQIEAQGNPCEFRVRSDGKKCPFRKSMKTANKTIKVGVVGCGYWGPNLIRNLRQAPDCQLKVICDMSEPRLKHMRKLYPEVTTTNRFEELLLDAELDAIVVATPVRFHFEMA